MKEYEKPTIEIEELELVDCMETSGQSEEEDFNNLFPGVSIN